MAEALESADNGDSGGSFQPFDRQALHASLADAPEGRRVAEQDWRPIRRRAPAELRRQRQRRRGQGAHLQPLRLAQSPTGSCRPLASRPAAQRRGRRRTKFPTSFPPRTRSTLGLPRTASPTAPRPRAWPYRLPRPAPNRAPVRSAPAVPSTPRTRPEHPVRRHLGRHLADEPRRPGLRFHLSGLRPPPAGSNGLAGGGSSLGGSRRPGSTSAWTSVRPCARQFHPRRRSIEAGPDHRSCAGRPDPDRRWQSRSSTRSPASAPAPGPHSRRPPSNRSRSRAGGRATTTSCPAAVRSSASRREALK